jgi:putative cell wall-binding protein
LAASLAVSVLGAVAGSAAGAPTVTRFGGADRYATNAAVVDANFSPGVAVAYVATGINFPDGLAGGAAASNQGGPLLLVAPDALPPATATELTKLKPGRIVVLGGSSAVSAAVQTALQAYTTGTVTRVAGSDRYGTAADLAGTFAPGAPVYLATGANFPDALAASAAAAAQHAAMLLTSRDALPAATAQALARLQPSSITIVGSTSAVSAAVATQLGAYSSQVHRLGAADRYATAAAVAASVFPSATDAFIASGQIFPDALSAGPAAGAHSQPLLLAASTCLPQPTADEVAALHLTAVTLVGGTAALGQGVASLTTCTAAPPAGSSCGTKAAGTHYSHIIWIWMENKSYGSVIGSHSAPYENGLAAQCGLASNYNGVSHPSLPNYLAATGGSTFGVTDDANPSAHPIAAASLFSQLGAPGLSWRGYQESMPSTCAQTSSGLYAVKHNPAAYYTNVRAACGADDVALTGNFDRDVAAGTLPSFSFVTPNLCNDTHDCSVSTGDAWLAGWVPRILAGPNYRAGDTAIVLVWDEGTGSDNRVPAIVVAPSVRPATVVSTRLDHYALLRGTENLLGLPPLGAAASAPSLATAFGL